MSGWVSLIAQTNFLILPLDKYVIKGKPEGGIISKHFTGPRRHEMYAYGIDKVRELTK
jgi:hypothetical protein